MFHMTVPSWISCNIEVHMISSVFFFLYILNVIELSTSVGNPPLHPPPPPLTPSPPPLPSASSPYFSDCSCWRHSCQGQMIWGVLEIFTQVNTRTCLERIFLTQGNHSRELSEPNLFSDGWDFFFLKAWSKVRDHLLVNNMKILRKFKKMSQFKIYLIVILL